MSDREVVPLSSTQRQPRRVSNGRYRYCAVLGLALFSVAFNVLQKAGTGMTRDAAGTVQPKEVVTSNATTTQNPTVQQQPSSPQQDGRIQIIDNIMYNGEEILLPRITMLYDSVDYFYISESTLTFSGQNKSLYSLQQAPLLGKYADKIIWITYDEAADPRGPCKDAWEREARQRQYPLERIRHDYEAGILRDDFVILHTDLDELPDPAVIAEFHVGGKYHDVVASQPASLVMRMFYYNFHWTNKRPWILGHTLPGLLVLQGKYSFPGSGLHRQPEARRMPSIPDAGWHASYFGDVDFIIRKIENFSHQEYNKPEFKRREYIKECFETGKDLFFRSIHDLVWFNYTTLPPALQEFHRAMCAKQGIAPDLPPPNPVIDCGCNSTCFDYLLYQKNPALPFSCLERIKYVMTRHKGTTTQEACTSAAAMHACDSKCDPSQCDQ